MMLLEIIKAAVGLTLLATCPAQALANSDASPIDTFVELNTADTLAALYANLEKCLRLPVSPLAIEMTLRFSLKRDGSLLGRPSITHSSLSGSVGAQEAFVRGVLGAFNACLPLSITDRLGGAVAGRPIYFRIKSEPPHVDI